MQVHSAMRVGAPAPARLLVQNVDGVETFDRYYRRDFRSVVGLAFVMTGSRWMAEELAQEAMADAYRRWSTIGQYDDPGAWVRRVMINKKVSLSRRVATEAKVMLRLAPGPEDETVDISPRTGEVWAAVRKLPRRQAQAIALVYWEDRPLVDVAAILGVGVETVKTHLKRGRAALSSELAGHWDGPT